MPDLASTSWESEFLNRRPLEPPSPTDAGLFTLGTFDRDPTGLPGVASLMTRDDPMSPTPQGAPPREPPPTQGKSPLAGGAPFLCTPTRAPHRAGILSAVRGSQNG